jgi:hypothetical protein
MEMNCIIYLEFRFLMIHQLYHGMVISLTINISQLKIKR